MLQAADVSVIVALRNYRKDGALFWQQLDISPVRDESGDITHFVGIQQPTTERNHAEQILRDSIESLTEGF